MPRITLRLVLASQSLSRRAMLDAAGVLYDSFPANIDERAIEAGLPDLAPGDVALVLARAKAHAVAAVHHGRVVLGSDSLVVVGGRRFAKPVSRQDATGHLRWFSGRAMELYSAAVLIRDDQLLWQAVDRAVLQVRPLSDEFIAGYLDAEWPHIAGCVGAFRIEAMGVQLFAHIEGSHFTVLGLPLLPVLAALRDHGVLAA